MISFMIYCATDQQLTMPYKIMQLIFTIMLLTCLHFIMNTSYKFIRYNTRFDYQDNSNRTCCNYEWNESVFGLLIYQ